MAIVRELLIKLGFQTDKKAITETNKAITGFKTRFAVVATAATFAFSKLSQFFGDIATATLDSDDLAKSLGITLKELISIQKGFSNFRIDEKQVNEIFSNLNDKLRGFLTKTDSALAEFSAFSGVEINPLGGSVKLFDTILKYLSTISNEQQRIFVASNLFGKQLGTRISKISQNIEQFNDVVNNSIIFGEDAEKAIPALKEYDDAIRSLGESWKSFAIALSTTVVPVLTTILDLLSYVLKFYRDLAKVFTQFTFEPLVNTVQNANKAFSESSFGKFVNSGFRTIGNNINSDLFGVDEIFERQNESNGLSPVFSAPNTNLNINITVPEGTPREQTAYMADQIGQRIEDVNYNAWRQIQNNNPMVE